jgi:hypothetical protein
VSGGGRMDDVAPALRLENILVLVPACAELEMRLAVP